MKWGRKSRGGYKNRCFATPENGLRTQKNGQRTKNVDRSKACVENTREKKKQKKWGRKEFLGLRPQLRPHLATPLKLLYINYLYFLGTLGTVNTYKHLIRVYNAYIMHI